MNERSIFVEAVKRQDPHERSSYLNTACAENPELRSRIEVLLQKHEHAGRSGEAEKAAATVVRLCAQLRSEFPDDCRYRETLGFAHTVLGHWDQAADAFVEAAQLAADPTERCGSYSWVAKVQAAAGDFPAYHATCQKLFEEYGNTEDPKIASYLVYVFLWMPQAVSDADRVVELVELASSETLREHHDVMLAIALYRAGRYQEAADRLERELDKADPGKLPVFRAIARIALPGSQSPGWTGCCGTTGGN